MKFIDLFAGIGGFRLGMESAGHKCVAFCEIDKFARASYKAIHDTKGETEFHDITRVTDEQWEQFRGTIDVICGGFPCQAFSVAGKRKGFLDETRGTLFFEIARAAKQIKPRILFLENVKGLLSHDKGRTFGVILNTLDELGYDCEWQVLNSKNFGVPQNRERVFIIGHLRGGRGREVFPIRGENSGAIDVLNKENGMPYETDRVYSLEGLSPTLKAMQGRGPKIAIPVLTPDRVEKRQNSRRFKENGESTPERIKSFKNGSGSQKSKILIGKYERTEFGKAIRKKYENGDIELNRSQIRKLKFKSSKLSNTITTVQKDNLIAVPVLTTERIKSAENGGDNHKHQATITKDMRIRKLTPRECWRLQSFPDWAFDKAQEVNSNSQLYKQAGNSVTVNVITEIARRLEDI